jgi:hypothetical protein
MDSETLLRETLDLWNATPATVPDFGRSYSTAEQAERERRADQFLDAVESEVRRAPRTRAERDQVRQFISDSFAVFAENALDLTPPQVELLLDGGFSSVGSALGRRAREFDPEVSALDILQACRNAWTACGLQALSGRRMHVTPAIFGYSMLYPYSDNYLDSREAGAAEKLGFSARFRGRLAGECVAPANAREHTIWRLVASIEEQYPREEHPDVYESLLAIHRAQEKSLRLRRCAISPADVLGLSFEKGGTSVLADACLVSGQAEPAFARFAFEWGVLLQLADDLQDIREDAADGAATIFTEGAQAGPLDEMTSRTLRFGEHVMRRLDEVAVAGSEVVEELLRLSSRSILIRSAGHAGEWYTPEYLARLERYSPFRFAYLRHRRERLARRSGLLLKMFDAFLAAPEDEPAFPMLPSTIMPRA